jgi:hypothetical protein
MEPTLYELVLEFCVAGRPEGSRTDAVVQCLAELNELGNENGRTPRVRESLRSATVARASTRQTRFAP